MELTDLEKRFAYHPPKHSGIAEAHSDIRDACFKMAQIVDELCPDGREKSLAITKLEECMFWANGAIARTQRVGTNNTTNEKG